MAKGKLLYILFSVALTLFFARIPMSAQKSNAIHIVEISDRVLHTDTSSILPASVEVLLKDKPDNTVPFTLRGDTIFVSHEFANLNKGQEVIIKYRVFDFKWDKTYFHLDSSAVVSKTANKPIGYKYYGSTPKLISGDNLNYNGSFSRGFSVGNAQSLVLNSQFNLQLAGELGSGIKVAAAISDDNIPIQPEGNTQRLQEFDRVFIKVSKGKTSVLAGDFQLQSPKSYFVKYLKKLKGLSVQNSSQLGDLQLTSDASVAVSRGKFARQTLPTVEGNQGPYKLTGNSGERFLIVLSGTEKVFLDGRLLERGYDYDYVIDYNRAEIIFTSRTLVRRESRFIVEFEYTDQSYLRTLYTINNYLSSEKWDLNVNFYNEQDSKAATGDIVLDSIDLATLAASGDDLSAAVRSGIFSAADTANIRGRLTYELKPNPDVQDTAVFILQYSEDPNASLVTAIFTELGPGEGRYSIDDKSNINGRVYKFVGQGQGAYEPIIKITPPEKLQILSVGSQYRISKNGNIGGELSISNRDFNRLSTVNDEDNMGVAVNLNHQYSWNLGKKWKLKTNSNLESLDPNYRPLNPYRSTEFTRDWNIPLSQIDSSQILANIGFALHQSDSARIYYKLGHFNAENQYKGTNHRFEGDLIFRWGLQSNTKISSLSSTSTLENSSFVRINSVLKQRLSNKSHLNVGLVLDTEHNERSDQGTFNLLNAQSNGYRLYQVFVENQAKSSIRYKLTAGHRVDLQPDQEKLSTSLNTNEIGGEMAIDFSNSHNLEIITNYRDLQVVNQELAPSGTTSKTTLLTQLTHNIGLGKGSIIANTNYLVSSGQQPKVEFSFEKVPVGQGDYIYVGDKDSTLTNTDFRYAPELGIADYIKLTLVNGEFVTTKNQSLSQSLRLTPSKFWHHRGQKSRWISILSKFSSLSTIRIDKKVLAEEGVSFFDLSRNDTENIVQYNGLIANTLFINKGARAYDIQLSQRSTSTIYTQISGLETRTDDNYNTRVRTQLWSTSDFILDYTYGIRTYTAELIAVNNHEIEYHEFAPKVSLRPTNHWRIIFEYRYDIREELKNFKVKATSNALSFDISLRKPNNYNVGAKFSLINVDYPGSENTVIEYDLLRGLKDGRNIIANLLISKRLQNSIDLTLSYEGRKNGSNPIVHIARAQVKATF